MKNKLLDGTQLDEILPFEESSTEDKPPIFQNWNQMYAFVLIMHVIVISLFYWITKAFS